MIAALRRQKPVTSGSVLGLLAALASFPARAETCIFFIGDGAYARPQVSPSLVADLARMTKRWESTCTTRRYLVSIGGKTRVYDRAKNVFVPYTEYPIDAPATLAALRTEIEAAGERESRRQPPGEVKVFFGDHGEREGTRSVEGVLPPETIRDLFRGLAAKKIPVRSVFDHCHAGIMQGSLYDPARGEVYGCGFSSSNDEVSVGLASTSDVVVKVPEAVRRNQIYLSGDAENHYVTTADRFLDEYATPTYRRFAAAGESCPMRKIESLLAFDPRFAGALAHPDLREDAAALDAQHDAYLAASAEVLRKAGLREGRPTPERIAAIDAAADAASKRVNDAYLEARKKDPVFQKSLKEKDALYAAVEKDLKGKRCASPPECPQYDAYQALHQAIQRDRETFLNQTTVEALSAKDPIAAATPKLTLRNYVRAWSVHTNQVHIAKVMTERAELLKKRKIALLEMMKRDDARSIGIYRKLKECLWAKPF